MISDDALKRKKKNIEQMTKSIHNRNECERAVEYAQTLVMLQPHECSPNTRNICVHRQYASERDGEMLKNHNLCQKSINNTLK